MNYSYNLYSNVPLATDPAKKSSSGGNNMIPVRVVDVILDDTHEEWDKLGRSEAVGAIKYRLLKKDIEESDSTVLPVAYPISSDLKKFPLKNEIVLLTSAPGYGLDTSNLNVKTYYNTIVNLWNHPNHAAFPDDIDKELDLGKDIDELTEVNPMQPFPGDIILDGRQGQSLRLTGFPSPKNEFVDSTNIGKPLTILSNGQKQADNPYDPIIEDVNEDASSIYLTSDHLVPLSQVRDKTDSYGTNPAPPLANQYKGSQVVVNGGRLYFNAKEEGIFLNSNEYLELQSNYINVDGVKEVSLDAELIFLGAGVAAASQGVKEPVLLGNATLQTLNSLVEIVKGMANAMSKAITVDAKKIPGLNSRGALSSAQLSTLQKNSGLSKPFGTSPLKSKKVFVE
jgi:hypothetical protein